MIAKPKKILGKRKGIKMGRWFFYNLPVYHPLKEYEEKTDEIVKKFRNTEDLLGIYQPGHVVPGISDIDLFFVFENDTKRKTMKFNEENYLFIHPPEYFTKRLMEKLFCYHIRSRMNLKKLYGETIRFSKPGKKFFKHVNLIWSVASFCFNDDRTIYNYFSTKKIDLRFLLSKLNFFRTRVAVFKAAGVKLAGKNDIGKFCEDVDLLRKRWFEDQDYEKVAELLERSMKIISYLRRSLISHLEDTEMVNFRQVESVFLNRKNGSVVFFTDSENENFDRLNLNDKNIVFVPSTFQFIFHHIRNSKSFYGYAGEFRAMNEKKIEISNTSIPEAARSFNDYVTERVDFSRRLGMSTTYNPGMAERIISAAYNFGRRKQYYKIKLISSLFPGSLRFFYKRYTRP